MSSFKKIKQNADKLLGSINSAQELEQVRLRLIGRKGDLTLFLRTLKDLPLRQRKELGPKAQKLKRDIEVQIKEKDKVFKGGVKDKSVKGGGLDVSRPGLRGARGGLHPLTQVEREIVSIFGRLGFSVEEGPDIETEYYNFDALNIPKDHPARDMWDTFWFKEKKHLLRTHTSPVQVRYMEKAKPPFKIVVPGNTFRYEAIDATHNIQFSQLEGLLVDRQVSVANFKSVIEDFFSSFLKRDAEVRLRPSYFPFVEPGFEVDVFFNGKWLEMMGAGMVHPNVYKNAGLNPKDWQGFAFGMGIDRLAMVKYGINDVRHLYQNDIRFLKQF